MRVGTALLAAVVVLLWAAPAGAATQVPPGFRVEAREDLATGLEHLTLVRDEPRAVVHVAHLSKGAAVVARAVLSNDRVAGPEPVLERTTEMCRRVRCLVAVNADFAHPVTRLPVGGVVSGGQLLRSPSKVHHQVSIARNGAARSGVLPWSGKLMTTDLRPVGITAVNVEREAESLVLFTPAWGPATGTNGHGAELVVRMVEPAGPLRLDHTALVELVELRDGQPGAAIPADGAVLSGHGAFAQALRDVWGRVEGGVAGRRALLRLEVEGGISESVGGTPVIVREGRAWVGDDGTSFVRSRHPRTIVGWTADGGLLLVTVDGRQPGHSVGMTMVEAAHLMVGLGAVEALNLDGGGSTTFVRHGAVVNSPSDRAVRRSGRTAVVPQPRAGDTVLGAVERPVAVALALVPAGGSGAAAADPLAADPRLPVLEVALPADPASDPWSGRPALLPQGATPEAAPTVWLLLALALNGVAALLWRAQRVAATARRTSR